MSVEKETKVDAPNRYGDKEDEVVKHRLYSKDIVAKEHTIYMDALMDHPELDELFNTLHNAGGNDMLTIRIDSPGGMLSELYRFKALIVEKFYGRCTTILDPAGASAGALTFTYGNKRIVYEHSWAMFHDWSGGVWGKASDIEKSLIFRRELFKKTFREDLKDFFTEEEIENMFKGQEFWLDAKELCERKIATHVITKGKTITAEEYLKQFKTEEKKEVKKPTATNRKKK